MPSKYDTTLLVLSNVVSHNNVLFNPDKNILAMYEIASQLIHHQ